MNVVGRLLWPCITALIAVTTSGVVAQERPDRTRPPALGPAPGLRVPPIQKRTLSNGIPVWVVESREVPLVQVNLLVLAGSGDDPAGKFGVASLTAGMLDEGAGSRSKVGRHHPARRTSPRNAPSDWCRPVLGCAR